MSSASILRLRQWGAPLIPCGSVLCVPSTEGNKMVLLFIVNYFICVIILLVTTVLLHQKGRPAQSLLAPGLQCSSARHSLGTAHGGCTQSPSPAPHPHLGKSRLRGAGGVSHHSPQCPEGNCSCDTAKLFPGPPSHGARPKQPQGPRDPLWPARLAAAWGVSWHSPNPPQPKTPCALPCTQRANQTQRKPPPAAKVLEVLLRTAGKYKELPGGRALPLRGLPRAGTRASAAVRGHRGCDPAGMERQQDGDRGLPQLRSSLPRQPHAWPSRALAQQLPKGTIWGYKNEQTEAIYTYLQCPTPTAGLLQTQVGA